MTQTPHDSETRNAIEHIVEEQIDRWFRFAFFRTGDRTEAEDIVQDTMLKIFEHDIGRVPPEKLSNYIMRALANTCRDRMRRAKDRMSTTTTNIAYNAACDDSANHEWEQEYERINSALRGIPDEQAEILRMRAMDGMRFTEIADILGIPTTTAKSRFKYGIEKLRKQITN